MPSGPALSPWAFPERFTFFAFFPKRKIQRILFFVIDVNARAGNHFFQITSGQTAVLFVITYGKIYISIHTISISFLFEDADQSNHLFHMLGGFRGYRGSLNSQRRHIFVVQFNVTFRYFRNADALFVGAVDNLVINISKIFNIRHLISSCP